MGTGSSVGVGSGIGVDSGMGVGSSIGVGSSMVVSSGIMRSFLLNEKTFKFLKGVNPLFNKQL